MALGLWLLVGAIALIGGLWLYNAWPDLALLSIGQRLGIYHQELLTGTDRWYLVSLIKRQIEQRYLTLSWRTLQLFEKLSSRITNPLHDSMHADLLGLTSAEPTREHCQMLREYLATFEGDAVSRSAYPAHCEVLTGLTELIAIYQKLERLIKKLDRNLA